MRFDDRLATVLGQPAVDVHGRAVQWRQLVELIARDGGEASPELRDRAFGRIASLMKEVPAELLSATARAIAGPQVPAELVALFAARGASAAAALVTAADLAPEGWAAVRAVAAPDLLPFLSRVAPLAATPEPAPPPAAEPAAPEPKAQPSQDLPAGLFRWECGPTGEIDWVEGAPRAALIGRSLTEHFADRFAARLPFSDEPLVLAAEGELAGEWRWSGSPAFFPDTGRFAGYRGFARREGVEPVAGAAPSALPQDDDLRELMHELRTPLNAIIGFGEIIEGQYLGPAHRAYRARAATIVAEARGLADAVDNLDLAAKLRSGRLQGDTVAELEGVRAALAKVQDEAAAAAIRLDVVDRLGTGKVALPPALTERLVGQLAGTLTRAAVEGEAIVALLDRIGNQLALAIDRPAALRAFSEDQLLSGDEIPGTRFGLRLVQGIAAMIGGRLDIASDRLILLLPLSPDKG